MLGRLVSILSLIFAALAALTSFGGAEELSSSEIEARAKLQFEQSQAEEIEREKRNQEIRERMEKEGIFSKSSISSLSVVDGAASILRSLRGNGKFPSATYRSLLGTRWVKKEATSTFGGILKGNAIQFGRIDKISLQKNVCFTSEAGNRTMYECWNIKPVEARRVSGETYEARVIWKKAGSSLKKFENSNIYLSGGISSLMDLASFVMTFVERPESDTPNEIRLTSIDDKVLARLEIDRSLQPYAHKVWTIDKFTRGGRTVSFPVENDQVRKPYLIVRETGGISMSGGCNGGSGTAQLTQEGVRIVDLLVTTLGCAKPILDRERHFYRALTEQALHLEEDGALVASGEYGFRAVAEPAGARILTSFNGRWRLAEVWTNQGNRSSTSSIIVLPSEYRPRITLDDGSFVYEYSCHRTSATAHASKTEIEFAEIKSADDPACQTEEKDDQFGWVDELEPLILQSSPAISRWGDTLVITLQTARWIEHGGTVILLFEAWDG